MPLPIPCRPIRAEEWLSTISEYLRDGRWRALQELSYFVALNAVGLQRLRTFRSAGEAHRWAQWRYRPGKLNGEALLIESTDTVGRVVQPHLGWEGLISNLTIQSLCTDHGSIVNDAAGGVACCFPRYSARPFPVTSGPGKRAFPGLFGIDLRRTARPGSGSGRESYGCSR